MSQIPTLFRSILNIYPVKNPSTVNHSAFMKFLSTKLTFNMFPYSFCPPIFWKISLVYYDKYWRHIFVNLVTVFLLSSSIWLACVERKLFQSHIFINVNSSSNSILESCSYIIVNIYIFLDSMISVLASWHRLCFYSLLLYPHSLQVTYNKMRNSVAFEKIKAFFIIIKFCYIKDWRCSHYIFDNNVILHHV